MSTYEWLRANRPELLANPDGLKTRYYVTPHGTWLTILLYKGVELRRLEREVT